jgi:hypothetical protein
MIVPGRPGDAVDTGAHRQESNLTAVDQSGRCGFALFAMVD